jgi:hypothetical protein
MLIGEKQQLIIPAEESDEEEMHKHSKQKTKSTFSHVNTHSRQTNSKGSLNSIFSGTQEKMYDTETTGTQTSAPVLLSTSTQSLPEPIPAPIQTDSIQIQTDAIPLPKQATAKIQTDKIKPPKKRDEKIQTDEPEAPMPSEIEIKEEPRKFEFLPSLTIEHIPKEIEITPVDHISIQTEEKHTEEIAVNTEYSGTDSAAMEGEIVEEAKTKGTSELHEFEGIHHEFDPFILKQREKIQKKLVNISQLVRKWDEIPKRNKAVFKSFKMEEDAAHLEGVGEDEEEDELAILEAQHNMLLEGNDNDNIGGEGGSSQDLFGLMENSESIEVQLERLEKLQVKLKHLSIIERFDDVEKVPAKLRLLRKFEKREYEKLMINVSIETIPLKCLDFCIQTCLPILSSHPASPLPFTDSASHSFVSPPCSEKSGVLSRGKLQSHNGEECFKALTANRKLNQNRQISAVSVQTSISEECYREALLSVGGQESLIEEVKEGASTITPMSRMSTIGAYCRGLQNKDRERENQLHMLQKNKINIQQQNKQPNIPSPNPKEEEKELGDFSKLIQQKGVIVILF